MLSPMARIRAVEPLDGYLRRSILTDGRAIDRDIERLMVGPVFEALRKEPAKSREVRVEYGSVAWPHAGAEPRYLGSVSDLPPSPPTARPTRSRLKPSKTRSATDRLFTINAPRAERRLPGAGAAVPLADLPRGTRRERPSRLGNPEDA